MLITLAFLLLLLLGIKLIPAGKDKTKKSQKKGSRARSVPPLHPYKAYNQQRKQKHKAYVAPVVKRKWRTPRRSSH